MQILDPSRAPDQLVEQDSGARWAAYFDEANQHGYTVLTGIGNELYHAPGGDMREQLQRYQAVELGGQLAVAGAVVASSTEEMRRLLGSGREANVFSMGPYAVREQLGIRDYYAALGDLQRMDALSDVIDSGLPRWLNLPPHYMLHTDPGTGKTYTVMQRVNGGLTAEDVIEYPTPPPERAHRAEVVERALGEHIDEARAAVPEIFDTAHGVLSSALRARGRDPKKYLTDWEPRNALIERLPAPIAGSQYSVHIIDQYRA